MPIELLIAELLTVVIIFLAGIIGYVIYEWLGLVALIIYVLIAGALLAWAAIKYVEHN
jgi:hypothetical protein